MANYLSTWMYVEDKADGGIYPQVGGASASQSVQNIYWRCVYVFFRTARLTARDGSGLRPMSFAVAAASLISRILNQRVRERASRALACLN